MKWSRNTALAVAAALFACGGQPLPPKSLVDARADTQRARDGLAQQLDPTDVHEADLALQRAEQAFQDAPGDPSSSDLAIIADRKAQMATINAEVIKWQKETDRAKRDLQALMASQLQRTQGQLSESEQALARQRQASALQATQLEEARTKLKDARDTIAKIATVKDDDRGMVITLQGEVLFKTGKWDLKPGAMAKLDQIVGVLKDKEQPITVFGHTDNVGSHDMNMELSRRRADTVADYLVHQGIPKDLVTAQGMGPDQPVSDNGSVDGRAANRRVEIVVQPRK